MKPAVTIIGSGFAAYQLIKTIRRQDHDRLIRVFTADNGDEYNKPDLSHVFSRQQSADDLITLSGEAFAQQYQVELFAHTQVHAIDTSTQTISANGVDYPYSSLVLATGAKAFIPPVNGNGASDILTLNSLNEYRAAQQDIAAANRILLLGGGLIGVELAMDLVNAGKQVTLIEPNRQLLPNLVPDFIARALEKQLCSNDLMLCLQDVLTSLEKTETGYLAQTKASRVIEADCVISAAGLRPNLTLAAQAGITTHRGICVNSQLKTSAENVFALGDCAEINGQIMAFLQPIILSANVIAKQILGQPADLKLPAMMVKVKTPQHPIQLAGRFTESSDWQVRFTSEGITAKAYDDEQRMTGFVVTKKDVSQAFPLLREIVAPS